jgi:hypothetical protein
LLASFLNADPKPLFHLAGFLPSAILTTSWYLILRHARSSKWRLALLSLPGTFFHELIHFVVGFLLFAKPTSFSVRPKGAEKSWVLGSVSFRKINVFNGAFVALAPTLLLPLAWFCLTRLAIPFWVNHQWGGWLLAGYFTSTILVASLPSLQDIKVGRPSLLLYGILGGLWWLWGSGPWRAWFH